MQQVSAVLIIYVTATAFGECLQAQEKLKKDFCGEAWSKL